MTALKLTVIAVALGLASIVILAARTGANRSRADQAKKENTDE